ncbi:MAG: MFS transporter, partial [Terriglobales bacterium]
HAARNFWKVITNPRFMLFLLIFTGYWVVYWQDFILWPLFVHDYINPATDTERLLATGPLVVIALTVAISALTQKMKALTAVILGTFITGIAWVLLAIKPTVPMAVATLVVVALGELTMSPRYYEYVSRLAPSGQQGTYMGFAFLPLGIGSLIAGPFGGYLIHHFGEEKHEPAMIWWCVTAVGVATTLLLWLYDKFLRPKTADEAQRAAG